MTNKIKQIADRFQQWAIDNGFVVQRYDAYSTNSVYFKLDYGVCNSVRISDHRGYKHLSYKFNLLSDIREKHTAQKNGYECRFYPFDCRGIMQKDILDLRDYKLRQFGGAWYKATMEQYRQANNNSPGFWSKAKLVCGA